MQKGGDDECLHVEMIVSVVSREETAKFMREVISCFQK